MGKTQSTVTLIESRPGDYLQIERLLMETIVPRPVVWVTTIGTKADNVVSLAPFTAVIPICNFPPLILLSIQRRDGELKTTARNILNTHEFVLNVLDRYLIEAAIQAASPLVPVENRFASAGVHQSQSVRVKPPRITECAASLECKLHQHYEIGREPHRADVFIGEVVCIVQNEINAACSSDEEQRVFSGVGALGAEWFLTATGLKRVPQA
jgi:flavin reductase (DIM6/NTAB) family NADH-FMN oxidoreductase RutF